MAPSAAGTFPPPTANWLLARLTREEYAQLLPHMEPLWLEVKRILYEPNQPITHVYFPLNGVCSMLTVMEDGTMVEVGTVGNEGMIGISVFLGADQTPGRAFAQVAGDAVRLPAAFFRQVAHNGGAFQAVMQRYLQALFTQVAQSTACNRVHAIEQRAARWILMTHDRVGAPQFPLTQEFLAVMLGVGRPRVSAVAGRLQQAGVITYRRGIMTVVDRAALEATACECYAIIKQEYDRLLG